MTTWTNTNKNTTSWGIANKSDYNLVAYDSPVTYEEINYIYDDNIHYSIVTSWYAQAKS